MTFSQLNTAVQKAAEEVFSNRPAEHCLEFRAAANASAEPADRPIKNRVLKRIYSSDDFKHVFLSRFLTSAAAALEIPADDGSAVLREWKKPDAEGAARVNMLFTKFFAALPTDPRFSTLIIEAIAQEKRWDDAVHGKFKSFADRLKAFVEKFFDKDHPVSRTATSVLLTGASVLVTYNVALRISPKFVQDNLALPVHLNVDASQNPVPVRVDLGSATTKIPVDLVANNPLEVQFKASSLRLDVSAKSADSSSSDSRAVAASLSQLDADLKGIRLGQETIATNVVPLQKSVATLTDAVEQTAATSDASVSVALKSIGEELGRIDTVAQGTNTVLTSIQEPEFVLADEDEKATAYLHWLGADHKVTQCAVTATASRIGSGRAEVQLVSLTNCAPNVATPTGRLWTAPDNLVVNESEQIPGVPFHLTLVSAEHHLLSPSQATLRFDPDLSNNTGISSQLASNTEQKP
jgi:hypothetical protein